jgi:hypothetical protein
LETLLKDMAWQLSGDHEKGEAQLKEQDAKYEEDQSRKLPDYLHEAFQRLIIKFLFANYHEEFMTMTKGPDFRKHVEVAPMVANLSSAQVSKGRASRSKKTVASGGSSSRNVESYNLRGAAPGTSSDSSSALKRKGMDKDANNSNSKDQDRRPPVSTVSCVSTLLFTSRLYTETTTSIIHAQYGSDGHGAKSFGPLRLNLWSSFLILDDACIPTGFSVTETTVVFDKYIVPTKFLTT